MNILNYERVTVIVSIIMFFLFRMFVEKHHKHASKTPSYQVRQLYEQESEDTSMNLKFRNMFTFPLDIYFVDGTPTGMYCGNLPPNGTSSSNTYHGHVFEFKTKNGEKVGGLHVSKNTPDLVILRPHKISELVDKEYYMNSIMEQKYLQAYRQEHGTPWLSKIGRDPPRHPIHPTEKVGDSFWMNRFRLKVVSVSPKVFVIENVLNTHEIQHLIELGHNKLHRSSVGSGSNGFVSSTRTSKNGWIGHNETWVVREVMKKLVRILDMKYPDDLKYMEQLQYLEYEEGEKYENHYDFGVTDTGYQRFSTLLLYLQTPEEGGGTSFPKAFNGKGLEVKASPGSAVLFYSMLKDGNADIKSLHAGMKVINGTKKCATLWTWS